MPERVRAVPFQAVRARQGNVSIRPLTGGAAHILPESVAKALEQCRGFLTLDQHAHEAALKTGQGAGVRAALQDLERRGLFISESEFLSRAARPAEPARITTIGIPSARPEGVARCLRSYRERWPETSCRVAASSALPEREAWVAAFARRGGDPEAARFALTGEAPGIPGGIRHTGANRNALLLATVGEVSLQADDDTLAEGLAAPHRQPGRAIHCGGQLPDWWFGAASPPPGPPTDLLAELADALGPVVRPGDPAPSGDFDHVSFAALLRGEAHALAAMPGLTGDCGGDSPLTWMLTGGATRERLVADPEAYARTLLCRRVLIAPPRLTYSRSGSCMAYCLALDHRGPMPPFPPLGRDQDGVFGLLMKLSGPGAWIAHLPITIRHEPLEERAFAPSDLTKPATGMALNDVLRLCLEGLEPRETGFAPAARRLRECAALAPGEFESMLIEGRVRYCSSAIAQVEASLAAAASKPAWWARDMQRVARAFEEAMAAPQPLVSTELGVSPSFYQAYAAATARLLDAWPMMVKAARQMRDTEPELTDALAPVV